MILPPERTYLAIKVIFCVQIDSEKLHRSFFSAVRTSFFMKPFFIYFAVGSM